MVDGAAIAHLNNKIDFVDQNIHSIFDDRFSRIESHLGMKSIGSDNNASTSNTDREWMVRLIAKVQLIMI